MTHPSTELNEELISLLKDFYSDRCRFNEHKSPYESTSEIYELWARNISRILDREKAEVVLERDTLRKFAQYVLDQYSWGNDCDGGDVQDKAESLGLLEPRPIDPEDAIDGETEHYFTKWTPK